MSTFKAPSGSRWYRPVALIVAATLAMAAVPFTAAEKASAATVNVDIGKPCVVFAFATYSLESGLQISPSTRSLEVVLPPMLWDIGHPLSWTISGPGGTDSSLDEAVPEGARSFIVPISADLFDPYQPTAGQFQLTFQGTRGGCRDDYIFEEVAQTSFTVDLAIAADGPSDVRIELTEDNATSATGGDPYKTTFSYAHADLVTDADWGDTISIRGPAGFWTRGPEGRWANPYRDAFILSGLQGGSVTLSPVVSADGSIATVTLPKAPPPAHPDNYDFWTYGGIQLSLRLSETSSYQSSGIRVHTNLSVPVPSVQGTVPRIEGIAAVGQRLGAVPGEWEDYAQLRYQWNREGIPITDGYESTFDYYVPGQRDVGSRLSVTVTGTNGDRVPTTLTSELTAVVPLAVPGRTSGVVATAGNRSATVRWTPPTEEGGSPITGFRVRAFTEAGLVAKTQEAAENATSLVVTGLTNGSTYTFDVSAINAIGVGQESERSSPVTCSADVVAPTVTSVRPAAGATGVPRTTNVRATLSEPVVSLTSANFTLRQGSDTVAGTVSYNPRTRVARFNPTSKLPADRTFVATVFGVKDAAGNRMPSTSWSFTTGPAPKVRSTVPDNSARGVGKTTDVSVVFSEPVTGVTGSTFVLKRGTTVVPAAVTYDSSTRTATLDPSAPMLGGTKYTVALSRAIVDVAGNPITAKSWRFITQRTSR